MLANLQCFVAGYYDDFNDDDDDIEDKDFGQLRMILAGDGCKPDGGHCGWGGENFFSSSKFYGEAVLWQIVI